jgi:hypothetical protein
MDEKSQCVVCCEVLSTGSMKPSKLICHLEMKHSYPKHQPVDFEQKLKALNDRKLQFSKSD